MITLDLSQNNIKNIWQRAFYCLAYLEYLDLSRKSIAVLHPQIFQNNFRLLTISMNKKKLTSLNPDLFKNNVELKGVGCMATGLVIFLGQHLKIREG